MTDALERVLRLVAEGRITPEEAAPLLDALEAARKLHPDAWSAPDGGPADDARASVVRVEVSEAGRPIVNLRVPLALGRSALRGIPGLSESTSERIREAITAGIKGPILDVDDGEGDVVRVILE